MTAAVRPYTSRLGRGCDPVAGSKILAARSASKPRSLEDSTVPIRQNSNDMEVERWV